MQKPPQWDKILPKVTHTKKNDKIDTSSGCMFCGKAHDHLQDRGLHDAHIFPEGLGCHHAWNLIPLCPSCHQTFDQIIKPRIVHALLIGVGGYLHEPDKPLKPQTPLKIADSMEQAIELLVDSNQIKEIKERVMLPGPNTPMFTLGS